MPEESGILGLGIRNTAQRIRNPSKTKFHLQRLESSTLNPESMADLDSLSPDERVISNMISMFVFFFEITFCFTKFFLQEVLRKIKSFSFFEKVTVQFLLR